MIDIMSTLVGVNFRGAEAKEIVRNLQVGVELELEAEPDNPYDSNAVKVIDPESGVFIGYLSRESNAETSEHLQNDGAYSCEVISFLSTWKPHLSIVLFEDDEED